VGMKKQPQHINPVQQYKALRMQIPVIEFADSTTEELLEPYPINGIKWYKTSRWALAITSVLAVVTVSLSVIAHHILAGADRQIRQGRYNNQKTIMEAVRQTKEIADRGVLAYVQRNQTLNLAAPVLQNCTKWSCEQGAIITFDYTLLPSKDPLDMLTSLDKGMFTAGYQRMDQKETETYRHIVTYGPK
jgi:hypothetical protein